MMVNVSRVVQSKRLGAQQLLVTRTYGKWVAGRFVKVRTTTLSLLGLWTVASPKDLQQVPEGDRVTGAMKLVTAEPVYQTDNTRLQYSDILSWRGAKYKVATVTPDIDYGFFRAVCVRLEGDTIG